MMAELLEVGVEFESFDAFQACMEQYEESNFVQFTRIDSRSVENARKITPVKVYNPNIHFTQMTFACTFGPRKGKSKSDGIRNASSRKIDCPVRLRISSTPDGQRLVIRESKLDGHNHELNEELYRSMSRQRQLDEETEIEIYNLISMHNDKRLARMLVRDRLTQEMGRSISVKDILNIEKKVGRKVEREKRLSGAVNSNVMKEVEENHQEEKETEEGGMAGEISDTNHGQEAEDDEEAEEREEDDEKELEKLPQEDRIGEDRETAADETTQPSAKRARSDIFSTPSESTTTISASPTNPGSSRPKRQRLKPYRFRDPLKNGSKFTHTSRDKDVHSISADHSRKSGQSVILASSSMINSSVRIKEEGEVAGHRKRNEVSSDLLNHTDDYENDEGLEDYRRRKLAIKEELLELEKRKMNILNEIVAKLDVIIKNQSKE